METANSTIECIGDIERIVGQHQTTWACQRCLNSGLPIPIVRRRPGSCNGLNDTGSEVDYPHTVVALISDVQPSIILA
jgi:hypothetical protein